MMIETIEHIPTNQGMRTMTWRMMQIGSGGREKKKRTKEATKK